MNASAPVSSRKADLFESRDGNRFGETHRTAIPLIQPIRGGLLTVESGDGDAGAARTSGRFERLGYRVGRLAYRLTHPAAIPSRHDQPSRGEFPAATVEGLPGWGEPATQPLAIGRYRHNGAERGRPQTGVRAHGLAREIRAVPVIGTTIGHVLGPYGANLLDRTMSAGGVAVSGAGCGERDWQRLVPDAIPAVAGLAAFAATRSVLEANAVGLTSATALHLFKLLRTREGEATAHPVVIGAAAGSVGLLAAALMLGPVGGVLGLVAPTPAGWAVIGLGVAAGVGACLLLDNSHAKPTPPALAPVLVR